VILVLLAVAALAGGVVLMVWAGYQARRRSNRTTAWLAWGAVAWTALVGVFFLFASVGESVSVSAASPTAADPSPEVVTTRSTETLLEHEGPSVLVVLAVPIVLALVGAGGPGLAARQRRIGAGSLLLVGCLLGAMSVGLFYLPAAVLLLAAGFMT
jgi:hypothetical protein